jgi:hypothetical protein
LLRVLATILLLESTCREILSWRERRTLLRSRPRPRSLSCCRSPGSLGSPCLQRSAIQHAP